MPLAELQRRADRASEQRMKAAQGRGGGRSLSKNSAAYETPEAQNLRMRELMERYWIEPHTFSIFSRIGRFSYSFL